MKVITLPKYFMSALENITSTTKGKVKNIFSKNKINIHVLYF